MTPATINPTLVILIVNGERRATATNIDPAVNVVVVDSVAAFNDAALGLPFNSTKPLPPSQPLNGNFRKGKA